METTPFTSPLQVLGEYLQEKTNFNFLFSFQFYIIHYPLSSCPKPDLSMLNSLCGRQSYRVP